MKRSVSYCGNNTTLPSPCPCRPASSPRMTLERAIGTPREPLSSAPAPPQKTTKLRPLPSQLRRLDITVDVAAGAREEQTRRAAPVLAHSIVVATIDPKTFGGIDDCNVPYRVRVTETAVLQERLRCSHNREKRRAKGVSRCKETRQPSTVVRLGATETRPTVAPSSCSTLAETEGRQAHQKHGAG